MLSKIFSNLFGVKAEETKGTEERRVITETFNADFQKITAKKVATENGIEYISKATGKKLHSNEKYVNQVYAVKGNYILLHPANDGMPTCPIEWYGKFDGENKMIMDNQSSFKCITNLSDIILQMVRLYAKYIDDDMFIASAGFAIRLDDEVCPDYTGKASFVLTDDAIRNNKVKPDQVIEAKKYFLNDFLDHFIGWNFGVAVKSNPQLERELLEFNNLVISKGLREDAGPGFEVWCSEDVQHYELIRLNTIEKYTGMFHLGFLLKRCPLVIQGTSFC